MARKRLLQDPIERSFRKAHRRNLQEKRDESKPITERIRAPSSRLRIALESEADEATFLNAPPKEIYEPEAAETELLEAIPVSEFDLYAEQVYDNASPEVQYVIDTLLTKMQDKDANYTALENIATTDFLTQLKNRRRGQSKLESLAFNQENRRQHDVQTYILAMDFASFKFINDKLGGDPSGDYVLRETAKYILKHTRHEDLPCRWGGDEFIIIYKDMNQEQGEERESFFEKNLSRVIKQTCYALLDTKIAPYTSEEQVAKLRDFIKTSVGIKIKGRMFDKNQDLEQYMEDLSLAVKAEANNAPPTSRKYRKLDL